MCIDEIDIKPQINPGLSVVNSCNVSGMSVQNRNIDA